MQNQRIEYLSEEDSLKRKMLAAALEALNDPALTSFKVDDLSRTVLYCLKEIMTADTLAIFLLTEDRTTLRLRTVLGLEETVEREVPVPLERGFLGQIVTQGLPLIVHDISTLESIPPRFHEQLSSLLGVPLIVHNHVIGVIYVGMKQEYIFTDSDVSLVLHSADYLAQAFERTLLIKTEHHAAEELIDAQLCAIVELVEVQQRVVTDVVEVQQRVATELAEAQQRVAISLVGAQLRTAVELVGAQLRTAIDLIETQRRTAIDLIETQLPTAGALVEAQHTTAGDLVEAQHTTAGDLVEAQHTTAGDLVEAQHTTAGNLVEAQHTTAGDLVEAQHTAGNLVEAQHTTAGDLVEAQLHIAGDLLEMQQHTAGDLLDVQHTMAGDLIEAQLHTARDLVEAQLHTARDLIEAQLHTTIDLMEAQQRVAIDLIEAQQRVAIDLMEAQQRGRIKSFGRMNELETIFNAIMDGIIVYNEQGRIFRSNRAAYHLLRDEYGYPFSPESLPLKRLLRGERLAASEEVTVFLHSRDDHDIQLSVTGAPLYDEQGHLYGAICVLRDVTSRKRMEQRVEILDTLLEMVELLVTSSAPKEQAVRQDALAMVTQQVESNILALAQHLLGCSHAIIIGIHQSTHILSPLALVGFSTEEEQRLKIDLTGTHLSLLINNPGNMALLEKQESLPFEVIQSPLLQSLFPMSSFPNAYLVPIHSAHQLIGLLGIVFSESTPLPDSVDGGLITAISKLCALTLQYSQQITERDQLMEAKTFVHEQLEQVNKMQGDFISVVSHEFRTALATIEGFSNLLRSEDYPGEEVKEYANDIYNDATRLHRMVTDLLDVEQMKKGKMQLRAVWVDMNTLLSTLVKQIELVSIRHSFHLSLDEKLPRLEGDPDKLMQVITNLLSNAIKYSPMEGDILIKSRREGNSVHVSIKDHGIGIASEFIANIFTPYHRVNSTSTRYIQGTGLGLSLAQEIIHLHNGNIWVESTLGYGSTFHFTLPLIREK